MIRNQHERQQSRMAALPADLKYENRRKVLEAFRYGQECTVADISALTGISRLTVMRAIQFFMQQGVLGSMGLGESSNMGGKKPERFALADERRLLCIALWPQRTQLSLYSIAGQPLGESYFATDLRRPIKDVFDELAKDVNCFLAEHELSCEGLYGVALSTAGTVDYETGTLRYSAHSPEWGENIPIRSYLARIVGDAPVLLVENAGKMAGRAVLLKDHMPEQKRIVTMFTAWGISACMLENGRILSGPQALIGEVGHITVDITDQERCGCGRTGCLERLVSLERLKKLLAENPAQAGSPLAEVGGRLDFAALFAAAEAGDLRAQELTDYLARCYSYALHNLAVTYNPDLVVFQGSVGHAGGYFDQQLKEYMRTFRYYPQGIPFEVGYDQSDLFSLNASGGWYMLNEHYFQSVTLYQEEDESNS
ncbi:MAG: ROK family transcriptional regulator [Clostridiales bacterium]|nr:ROK family transcriptional regulator [Clostridiales bacterium]